jgi:hypothetical protein
MRREQLLLRGFAVGTAAAAAAIAMQQRAARQAAEAFYTTRLEPTEPAWIGAGYGGAPVYWHASEWIEALHTASLEAIRAALPSDDLHPVQMPNGRAMVYLAATQYGDITANGVEGLAALPYGEVWVAAAVTRRPAPPLVPLFAPAASGRAAGWFVLHLPVTTKVARDVGRLMWGYPKFMADMDFEDALSERSVRLAEGGRTILTLTVRPAGRPSIAHGATAMYSVLDGQLIETAIPSYAIQRTRWGRSGGRLDLGDHQVADELGHLDISSAPFMTRHSVGQRISMVKGRPIGPARQYLGYIGDDRDLGRYVVHYPNTAPIDRYAPFAPTAGPSGTIIATAPATPLSGERHLAAASR